MKGISMRVCLTAAALLTAAVMFAGCSKTQETTKRERHSDKDETTVSETEYTGGTVNGYEYTLPEPVEWGPDLYRGWYIHDAEDEKYIMICDGMKSSGGHGIHVTSVEYDPEKDMIVITVMSTKDEEILTDNITHPCCYVSFDKIPESVRVVSISGDKYDCGGYI